MHSLLAIFFWCYSLHQKVDYFLFLPGKFFQHDFSSQGLTSSKGIEPCVAWRNLSRQWPNYILFNFCINLAGGTTALGVKLKAREEEVGRTEMVLVRRPKKTYEVARAVLGLMFYRCFSVSRIIIGLIIIYNSRLMTTYFLYNFYKPYAIIQSKRMCMRRLNMVSFSAFAVDPLGWSDAR